MAICDAAATLCEASATAGSSFWGHAERLLADGTLRADTALREAALDGLVRYYQTNAHRMRYALYRDSGFPIASGAAESAHRHVLQVRMKRAGQHWSMRNARKVAALRAALRTAGPLDLYNSIQRARARSRTKAHYWRRGHYRYAREGTRERRRCLAGSSD
jgi:hypothetical protein